MLIDYANSLIPGGICISSSLGHSTHSPGFCSILVWREKGFSAMSKGNNHHYVPRLLLRGFSPDGRSISLLNKNSGRIISRASISGQCSKNAFYANELDDALTKMEDAVGPIIADARNNYALPHKSSIEYINLMAFVVAQHARTQQARNDFQSVSKGMAEIVGVNIFTETHIREDEEIIIRNNLLAAPAAFDLGVALLVNKTGTPFIISDDPAIFHNTLYQKETFRGNSGLSCTGFQAFLPLSSDILLYVYDTAAYQVSSTGSSKIAHITNESDVNELNRLQLLNALENIYFNADRYSGKFASMPEANKDRHKIIEAIRDGSKERDSIIHTYQPPLCSDFSLQRVKIIPSVAKKFAKFKVDRWRHPRLRKFLEFFAYLLEHEGVSYADYFEYREWFLATKAWELERAEKIYRQRSTSVRYSVVQDT